MASKVRYSNGMYATTSKAQDNVSNAVFKALKVTHPDMTMGCNLDQVSGNCEYSFNLGSGILSEYYQIISRDGKVVEDGWLK